MMVEFPSEAAFGDLSRSARQQPNLTLRWCSQLHRNILDRKVHNNSREFKMARPREFDPDVALERAMQVFWVKGYEAASLDDLCGATGLNRSSLYAAFGDKQALFLETIDRYGDRAVARITAALSRPLPVRQALADFLSEMIDQIVSGPGRSGCFIGNCAAEVARHDRTAAASVKRNLDRVEAVFRDAFARGKERGELGPGTDVDALARFFVASTQGLRLMGKANTSRRVLEDIAGVMLRCVD